MHAPRATSSWGFSLMLTGMPSRLVSRSRRPSSSAPPPERWMPLASRSSASSAGVFSKASRMLYSRLSNGGSMARCTSSEVISAVAGLPVRASRPRRATFSTEVMGISSAVARSTFRSSAVR